MTETINGHTVNDLRTSRMLAVDYACDDCGLKGDDLSLFKDTPCEP